MRLARTATLTAAAAVLSATGLPAAAAAADTTAPTVAKVDVRPETVVLKHRRLSPITFRVRVTDDTGVAQVHAIAVSARDENAGGWVELERVSGTARDGVWSGTIRIDAAEVPGRWAAAAAAVDAAGNESVLDDSSPYDEYLVKRATRVVGFDAGPEPVRRNAKVTLTGRLQRVDATKGFVGVANQRLEVQFKAKGAKKYVRVGAVTTGKAGAFRTAKIAAPGAGTWRVVYAGTVTLHRVAGAGDFVAVR
jgi:Cu/Ag efflux protein CusF